MNQTEQMRKALEKVLKWDYENGYPTGALLRELLIQAHRQSYHRQSCSAEPAPLVRLTDDEIQAVWEPLHDALCLDHKVFASAIMDAMIEKNGGV